MLNKEQQESIENLKTYWDLEKDVSNGFNRLKAKIYNLIEATVTDQKQADAMKGLIKGFANDEYGICIDNMRYSARMANILKDYDDNYGNGFRMRDIADPLEQR